MEKFGFLVIGFLKIKDTSNRIKNKNEQFNFKFL